MIHFARAPGWIVLLHVIHVLLAVMDGHDKDEPRCRRNSLCYARHRSTSLSCPDFLFATALVLNGSSAIEQLGDTALLREELRLIKRVDFHPHTSLRRTYPLIVSLHPSKD